MNAMHAVRMITLCGVFLLTSCSGDRTDTHYTVRYVDEAGVEQRRSVPKEEHRTKIAVFRLPGQWGLRTGDWLAYGHPLMLWIDLQQNIYIEVIDPVLVEWKIGDLGFGKAEPVNDLERRRVAAALGADYFMNGKYSSDGVGMDLRVNIFDTESGEMLGTCGTVWRTFFEAVDSVSTWLRTTVVEDRRAAEQMDRPVAELTTVSLEAMRHLSVGWWRLAQRLEAEETIRTLEQAVLLDSTSALANLALYWAGRGVASEEAREKAIADAFRYAKRLPEPQRLAVEALYHGRRDQEKTRGTLALLLDLYPSSALAHESAARTFLGWGEDEKALSHFSRTLDLSPWRDRLFEFLIGLCRETGREERAKALCVERVSRFPRDADIRFLFGHLLSSEGEYEAALSELRKAVAVDPDHVRSLEGLALVKHRLGDLEGADEEFRKALKRAEPAGRGRIYEERDRAFFERGMIGKTLETLEEGQEDLASAEPVPAWQLDLEVGKYLAEVGNYSFALERFRRSPLRKEPAFSWMPELGEAAVLVKTGRFDEARAILEAVRTGVGEPGVEQAILEMTITGEIALASGKYAEALDSFEFVEALGPARKGNLLRIGRVYSRMGKPAEAESALARALVHFPNDPEVHSERALVLEAEGRDAEARTHLEEALRLWKDADPGIPHVEEARERLARLQQHTGS